MEPSSLSSNVESQCRSLQSIPTDVLEHHIFKYFDISILLVCSHVCSKLRKLSSIRLCKLPYLERHQNTVLQEIFRNGWAGLLSWFQAFLRYPSMSSLSELRPVLLEQCLSSAAEGNFISSLFLSYVISHFLFFSSQTCFQANTSTCSSWYMMSAASLALASQPPLQHADTCIHCSGCKHMAARWMKARL